MVLSEWLEQALAHGRGAQGPRRNLQHALALNAASMDSSTQDRSQLSAWLHATSSLRSRPTRETAAKTAAANIFPVGFMAS